MRATALALGLMMLAGAAGAGMPVTLDNFKRAESDHYFKGFVAKGCFGKLCHERRTVAVDSQQVIRMNRDTLYSNGVFDLSTPLTITMPETGGRFMSLQLVSQDHYVPAVFYGAGTHVLTQESIGTRYVALLFRTFMDPANPKDVAAANTLQDRIIVSQADPGRFEPGDWDEAQRGALSRQLNGLMPFLGSGGRMFGTRESVDPVQHLVGTAGGWGGNPVKDAIYLSRVVPVNDGGATYEMTLKDVPVDGFWSVIVYNAKGFFEAPESAVSVNSQTAKRNRDGSVTLRFGGDPKAANHLRIMPGWSYTVRLYRPRADILSGAWGVPEPSRVK